MKWSICYIIHNLNHYIKIKPSQQRFFAQKDIKHKLMICLSDRDSCSSYLICFYLFQLGGVKYINILGFLKDEKDRKVTEVCKTGKLVEVTDPQPETRNNAETGSDCEYGEKTVYLYEKAGLLRDRNSIHYIIWTRRLPSPLLHLRICAIKVCATFYKFE